MISLDKKNWNKRWITSDWHLGEDRMKIMMRPFKDQQENDNSIIEKHNSCVNNDDLVIVVGDAVNQNKPECLKLINKLNGHKVLIRGNHDRFFSDEELSEYFELIIKEGDGIELEVESINCWATHYPSQAKKDKFNLVGHIHNTWKFQLNSVNVGVDCNHFYPYNLDEFVPFAFNAISNFYDQDVWVAYLDINEYYKDIRGKKDKYFKN